MRRLAALTGRVTLLGMLCAGLLSGVGIYLIVLPPSGVMVSAQAKLLGGN